MKKGLFFKLFRLSKGKLLEVKKLLKTSLKEESVDLFCVKAEDEVDEVDDVV